MSIRSKDGYPTMQMWIQLKDHDDDISFPDGTTYQVHASGVLRVNSGKDIHLYSPSYWQEVTIDTQSANQRGQHYEELDDDLDWQ